MFECPIIFYGNQEEIEVLIRRLEAQKEKMDSKIKYKTPGQTINQGGNCSCRYFEWHVTNTFLLLEIIQNVAPFSDFLFTYLKFYNCIFMQAQTATIQF